MLKHYLEMGSPGSFFADTHKVEIEKRDIEFVMSAELINNCTMFRFVDVEEVNIGGGLLTGERKNVSGWYYLKGIRKSQEDVRKEKGECILLTNMIYNNWEYIVDCGASYPLNVNDKVLIDGKFV